MQTIGLIGAVVMNGVAYFFSDKIALKSSGAKPVTREELPRLYEVMERLCTKAGLPMPKLYVIPQPAPNAFATGRNPSHASVAVTAATRAAPLSMTLRAAATSTIASMPSREAITSAFTTNSAGMLLTKHPKPGRNSTRFIPTNDCKDSRTTVRLTPS